MQDFQLYEQILGLSEPWRVKRVTLNRPAGEVEVEVETTERTVWGCPQCQKRMHIHDWERRRWRHLDSCQFKTILVADVPRISCAEHGTLTVAVPWAEKYGRFTRLMERLAIDLMQECSIKAACQILRISWDEADGIKQRAVQRGLKRREAVPLPHICIDEKSAGRGHDYVTVVARVEPGRAATVWHVGDGRSGESLERFWQGLSAQQRSSIQAVAMDLWEPYFGSTLIHLDDAEKKIVHDPFHLVKHMNEAVDQVRRQEHKRMLRQNDQRLAGTKYWWLRAEENTSQETREQFRHLRNQTLQTSRAWAIKEMFRDFWRSPDLEEGKEFFRSWYGWAIRSRLQPVKKVARMFKRHLQNMLTYFVHRLSNGPLEGLNNRIQGLVKKAYGYRSRERFKIDILFHLGGLDLYPSP